MAIDTRHPREIRADIRHGKLTGVTAGLGQGYVLPIEKRRQYEEKTVYLSPRSQRSRSA